MNGSSDRPFLTLAGLPSIWLVVAVLVLPFVAACSQQPSNAQGPAPEDLLPEGFPVPGGAQAVSPGTTAPSVVTLRVFDASETVVAFYEKSLPAAGWEIEPWEGTGPTGDPASGFIIERGDEEGALSISGTDDDLTTVQVNMNQPIQATEGGPATRGDTEGED